MSREIVVSGILGWMRKIRRRKEEGKDFYRGAKSTLRLRMKKKLLDPTTWYKSKVSEPEKPEQDKKVEEKKTNAQKTKKRKREDLVEGKGAGGKRSKKDTTKSVLFCPYTPDSELARRLREARGKVRTVEE